MVPQLTFLLFAFALLNLSPVDAALFPKKSHVKHIDTKGFRDALQEKRAFVAAFVAPWCGHCQKLAPELMRAAKGLHPLVPVYAVDCDDDQNKPLCAEQGVKGFPTLKLFPQSDDLAPIEYTGTRTSSSIFYWTSQYVPYKLQRSQDAKGVAKIVANNPGKPKAVLMNKSNKMPLLWKVLSNKYSDSILFINCRDRQGAVSVDMGFEAGDKRPKVLVYGKDDKDPVLYEGILKFAALSEFFEQVIDGTVDISHASLKAKQEVLKAPESERKQLDDETRIGEADYGGFNPHENIDMDELIKLGFNPHGAGHPGAQDAPAPKANAPNAKAAGESAGKAAEKPPKEAGDKPVGKAADASTGEAGDNSAEKSVSSSFTPPLTSLGAESSSPTSQTQSATPVHEKTSSKSSRPAKDTLSVSSDAETVKESGDPVAGHTKDEL